MRAVQLLIKPASSQCNMKCRYCFYADLADNRAVKSYGTMTMETAELLVRSAFSSADRGGSVHFAFQGGEPTLAGLDFFRGFLALEEKYRTPGTAVSYSIQTNGMLLDQEWVELFRSRRFLVGLSVDGPREIHDSLRLDGTGRGTWERAARSLSLLQKGQVEVNLLCVVTRACARRAQKVYRALRGMGGDYLQFIPCLDSLDAGRGSSPYSLTPEGYGSFLCSLFDAWYLDWKGGNYASVRLFDDYVHLLTGGAPSSCAASGRCGGYLVVEADGSFYPCDFYALDQWRLGDVRSCTLEEAAGSERAERFLAGSRRPEACTRCRWFPVCRGGCRRDWQQGPTGAENYYCPAYQRFLDYAYPRLEEIARAELRLAALQTRFP